MRWNDHQYTGTPYNEGPKELQIRRICFSFGKQPFEEDLEPHDARPRSTLAGRRCSCSSVYLSQWLCADLRFKAQQSRPRYIVRGWPAIYSGASTIHDLARERVCKSLNMGSNNSLAFDRTGKKPHGGSACFRHAIPTCNSHPFLQIWLATLRPNHRAYSADISPSITMSRL